LAAGKPIACRRLRCLPVALSPSVEQAAEDDVEMRSREDRDGPTGRAATAKARTFVDFFERIFAP
jgi:hypothetical protein